MPYNLAALLAGQNRWTRYPRGPPRHAVLVGYKLAQLLPASRDLPKPIGMRLVKRQAPRLHLVRIKTGPLTLPTLPTTSSRNLPLLLLRPNAPTIDNIVASVAGRRIPPMSDICIKCC